MSKLFWGVDLQYMHMSVLIGGSSDCGIEVDVGCLPGFWTFLSKIWCCKCVVFILILSAIPMLSPLGFVPVARGFCYYVYGFETGCHYVAYISLIFKIYSHS